MKETYVVYGTPSNDQSSDQIVGRFESDEKSKVHDGRQFIRKLSKSQRRKFSRFSISKVNLSIEKEQS